MKITHHSPSPALYHARDLAGLSLEGIDSMRTLFHVISRLPDDPDTSRELARIGLRLANDYHNLVDCERENMEDKAKKEIAQ